MSNFKLTITNRFQIEFKTILKFAVVLYNPGLQMRNSYITIEIWNGKIRMIIKFSNDFSIELECKKIISDGHWHKIDFRMTLINNVELSVDNEVNSIKLKNQMFDFSEKFFIGGLDDFRKSQAVSDSQHTFQTHFQGCMRHILFNEDYIKSDEILITNRVMLTCLWNYPCSEKPCLDSANCYQIGLESFQCKCDQKLCIHSKFDHEYKVSISYVIFLLLREI